MAINIYLFSIKESINIGISLKEFILRPSSRDLLSQISQGASHFKGCWRNLHGLEFPSARRYFVLHAKPSDFTDAGTYEAICDPTTFTSVCQWTDQYPARNSNLFARFHPLSCERGIPARK